MAPSRSTTTWRIAEFLSGRGLTRLPTWMPGWWETRVVIRIWSNNVPARFQEFQVTASTLATDQIVRRVSGREVELSKRRAENPKPKLWRRFETPSYGTGRSVRFGDLDGDGRVEMLLAQNIPRVRGDGFDQISCLTAVTLEGQVLWQSGRPDPRNGLLTNDLPFQIHDIDGDGRNEVVLIKDFKLQIWDGGSGKLKHWVWMPKMPASSSPRP